MRTWTVGDVVEIIDHSDAHGDIGTIYAIGSETILVELADCLWPVTPTQIRLARPGAVLDALLEEQIESFSDDLYRR